MGFVGLDLLAIRHLARQLSVQAEEVRSAADVLGALVEDAAWSGADREAFVSEWSASTRPGLLHAHDLLRRASELALDGARGQEEASRS